MPHEDWNADIGPRVATAVEHALWQDLADALNRLEDWGLLPLGTARTVDAGDTIHGAGVREGGYCLHHGEGYLWHVTERDTSNDTDD